MGWEEGATGWRMPQFIYFPSISITIWLVLTGTPKIYTWVLTRFYSLRTRREDTIYFNLFHLFSERMPKYAHFEKVKISCHPNSQQDFSIQVPYFKNVLIAISRERSHLSWHNFFFFIAPVRKPTFSISVEKQTIHWRSALHTLIFNEITNNNEKNK